jgi:alkylhydroperoxidase family enzyme
MSTARTAWLVLLAGAAWAGPSPAAAPPPKQRFGVLSNAEAWRLLPHADPPLPAWARALAGSLPRTTTLMVALDHLHRANNPLGPALAGKLRWAAADELGCDYARRYAEADLRRAGAWGGSPKQAAERAALAFARKLTRAAHEVTDAEVAELLELFGPEKVVAMVHTVALANFQGRIFLALNVEVEPGGPLPPLDLRLDPDKRVVVPARRGRKDLREVKPSPGDDTPVEWQPRPAAELGKALERQKGRKSRIPLPGPEQLARIPPEAKAQASRVVWTTVSMGYQPLLTKAWFDCMRTFQQEAKLDPVFFNTMFWVVTRSNECFY